MLLPQKGSIWSQVEIYVNQDLILVIKRSRSRPGVEVTQVDSDDVLWQLISDDKSPGFDVFAVNTAELARYISAGLASPIDRSQIPNSRLQIPRFRDMNTAVPGIVKNGSSRKRGER